MKVFVVDQDCYSGHRLRGAFSLKEKADDHINRLCHPSIEDLKKEFEKYLDGWCREMDDRIRRAEERVNRHDPNPEFHKINQANLSLDLYYKKKPPTFEQFQAKRVDISIDDFEVFELDLDVGI